MSDLVARLKRTGEMLTCEAARRIEELEQLVAEMEDIRTGCLERDDDDDERHQWREGEDTRGIHWSCTECGRKTRREPQ